MPQKLPAIGEEVPDTLAPLGGEVGGLPPIGSEVPQVADFSTTNAKDAAGNAVVDGPIDLIAGAISTANPLPTIQAAGKALIPARAAQAAGVTDTSAYGPLNAAKGLLQAQGAVGQKMVESYQQGDYLTAARHAAAWLLPVIGPALDQQADKMSKGEPWRGAGEALGLGLGMVLPTKLPAKVKIPAVARNPNPVESAAIQAGQARGIPIDAGTATGNRFVRGIQAGADNTPIGAVVAERARQTQGKALERVGGELADQVHPSPVTAEQAGGALKSSTEELIRTLDRQADDAYGRLRQFESDPKNQRMVPDEQSQAQARQLSKEMAQSLGGHAPTQAELFEMRRIRAEMDAIPFTPKTVTRVEGVVNRHGDAGVDVSGRSAGAPVYDDILANAPGTSTMSRKEILTSIDQALVSGRFTNGAKGALEVARRRIAGDRTISKPSLPPEAGAVNVGKKAMLMPVDLRVSKKALQPIYDRLKRESELVPLMGEKARGLVALDRLIQGPDFAPVSVVDSALSDLKAMARGATMPELRSQGQGLAASAVSALDGQVQAAVKRSGPEAVRALEQGRAAVKGKFAVAEILESIKSEPVKAYRNATAPKDTAVAHLRQLQEVAPEVLPQVGRAWLEDALQTATSQGGFEHAAKLDADWRRLGPETKNLIFGGPEQVKALDQYFLLAKKLAESPNPSRSALSATSITSGGLVLMNPLVGVPLTLGAGALSKILRNPTALKMLTKGFTIMLGPGRTSKAMQAAGVANVVRAAKEAGAPLPAVADQSSGVEAR